MPQKIRLQCGDVSMGATLNDSASAAAVAEKLPLEGLAQTYGAEVYFFVDMAVGEDDPSEDAPPGTIAFWPAGSAVCIFFGQRPVSPVNVIGALDGDPNQWRDVISGSEIRMEKA